MMWDFITRYCKDQGIGVTFAGNRNLYGSASSAPQKVSNFRGGQALGGFVVDSYDRVAGPNSRLVCRRTHIGRHHDGVITAGNHGHADTVVFAAALFHT